MEKPKSKHQKLKLSAPQYSKNAETSKRARKKKKKGWRNYQRRQEGSTLATKVNATDTLARKNYDRTSRADQDLNKVTCYRYKNKS